MLIQLLIVVLIIGLLYAGPTFDNILITLAFYFGVIGSLIAGFWYAGRVSGSIADVILGGFGNEKTDLTLALAEQHERERKYQSAIDLYKKAIAKNRKNPAPRLKLANLYLRLKKYDLCLGCMEETLQACRGMPMSERCTLMNRMADICLQHKQDPAAASKILLRIISEYPESTYAAYARERIENLE